MRALINAVESDEEKLSDDRYDFHKVITALQENPEAQEEDLFRVEWRYLPILDGLHGPVPQTLWRRLADDPAFFCEAIALVFRSDSEGSEEREPDEMRQAIAEDGYRLISKWAVPPGLRSDGSLDANALSHWLAEVREKSSVSGHLGVAMSTVGHCLVHAPRDPDGLWIHRAAATALNKQDAEDMRDGFRIELINSRGIHWVDPTGKPERELAEKYRRQAESVDLAGFPRLAATLRDLADRYDRDAERVVREHEAGD